MDLLILVAEKRELAPFIRELRQLEPRYYEGLIRDKTVGVFVSGVGKKAVLRSKKRLEAYASKAKEVINIGNMGALFPFRTGTLVPVGVVLGENGQTQTILEASLPFSLATVNSLQSKGALRSQYPHAHGVDMELFHLSKFIEGLKAYKIVLDGWNEYPKRGFSLNYSFRIWRNSVLLSKFVKTLI